MEELLVAALRFGLGVSVGGNGKGLVLMTTSDSSLDELYRGKKHHEPP